MDRLKEIISEETDAETHLCPSVCDAEINIEGFQIYRADRNVGRAKG